MTPPFLVETAGSNDVPLLHCRYDDTSDDSVSSYLSDDSEDITSRRKKYFHDRINLAQHFEMCHHTNGFFTRYHMEEDAIHELAFILRCDLPIYPLQSLRSTSGNEVITHLFIVCIGLRFMGGELTKSLADIFGVSIPHCHTLINRFLLAVDNSNDSSLSIDLLPRTKVEKTKMANEWKILSSSSGVLDGHLGPLDGWLCITEMPWDVHNPVDYRSGHYQRYGLNVQAMCDANLRIIYFFICGPGKMNDAKAFRRLHGLQKWLESLEGDEFISSDNAYTLTKRVIIPFSGGEKFEPYKLVFCFLLCQLRIRIKMTFGRLTTKWRIFRSNLTFSTPKNSLICRVGARLHNYVINYNIRNKQVTKNVVDPLLDGPDNNLGYLAMNENIGRVSVAVDTTRRAEMLNNIIDMELQRPYHEH